ncbi:MAG: DUF1653 domain-containing protein [Candidatus Magasanikbacteria bacterium]|nr:DUF1653 domain-containing protein [Candidatus Magasanikbacteria bacterium]
MQLGIYQHFKGGRCEVIGVGKVEATGEDVVLYKSLQDKTHEEKFFPKGSLWTRPLSVFLETVEQNGKTVARFTPLIKIAPFIYWRELFLITLPPWFIYILSTTVYGLWPEWALYYQLDTPLHFFGGASVAMAMFIFIKILERAKLLEIKNSLVRILIILVSVMAVTVLWEGYEFLSDTLRGTVFQPSVWDTMKDLILGALGGMLLATGLVWWNKKIG